jgi:hypothetical protein
MKLDVYIMAHELISMAYLILANPSHQSVCLFVYSFIVARQPRQQIRNSRRIVGRVVFYAVRVVSK